MDAQWELWFEQHESPMEDQVIQISTDDDQNPKPIFMSKNITSKELQGLIELIRECVDVFTWK